MLFAVRALDHAGALPKRQEVYKEHFAHLDAAPTMNVRIVISGPLLDDASKNPIGSLFILEAEDRAIVEAYNQKDPFYIQGVWEKIEIHAFNKKRG